MVAAFAPMLIPSQAIRSSSSQQPKQFQEAETEDSPEAQQFVKQQQGFLSDRDTIAAKVIDFLHRDDLAQGTIYDIRKLL